MIPYDIQLAWAWWTSTDPLWRWSMVFYAMQLGDGITTYIALKMGGAEANPVVRKAIEAIGLIPSLLIFKGLSIIGVYFGGYAMGADVVMFWALIYVGVVVWNVAQIVKLRAK